MEFFLDWTPIFDWCVVRWGSKNKHHKNNISKRYWTTSSTWKHNREDLCIQSMNQQPCTFDNHNQLNHRRSNLESNFCWCFIVDPLMQHKSHCINLIGRSLKNMKNAPNNTCYSMIESAKSLTISTLMVNILQDYAYKGSNLYQVLELLCLGSNKVESARERSDNVHELQALAYIHTFPRWLAECPGNFLGMS